MRFSQIAWTAGTVTFLWASAAFAGAPSWHPVPGAPDVAVELGSMQLERTRVVVWVRWWGRHALVPELALRGARAPRVQRTALLTEFDCSQRTMRVLAVNAYDGSGTPTFMSSTPGPLGPVQGEEMEWTYDAVCEVARTERRM